MNPLKITKILLSSVLFLFSMMSYAADPVPMLTFVPLTETHFNMTDGDVVTVQYTITSRARCPKLPNGCPFHMSNYMSDTPWFTMLSGPGLCTPDASSNFYLLTGASCTLALRINGNKVPYSTAFPMGPRVCAGVTNTNMNCFEPDTLNNKTVVFKTRRPSPNPYAYIANSGAGNLLECILKTGSEGSISSCTSKAFTNMIPNGMAIKSTNTHLYFTSRTNGTVSVCPIEAGKIVSCQFTGDLFTQPSAIALDGSNERAYVTNYPTGDITVCKVTGGFSNLNECTVATMSFTNPTGIAVNQLSTKIYVADATADQINVCDLSITGTISNCQLTGDFDGASPGPYGIALSKDGTTLYTANAGGSLSSCPINTTTGLVGTCTTTDDNYFAPKGIAISSDGRLAYVVNSGANNVLKCTIRTNKTFGTCVEMTAPLNDADGIALLGTVI